MRLVSITRFIGAGAVAACVLGVPSLVHAQSLTLTLHRASLINDSDAAGTWQHEGGTVLCPDASSAIAEYILYRRTNGSITQNSGAMTLVLTFWGADPPENMTLQGVHSFNTGKSIGSVSAASSAFASIRGKAFAAQSGVTGTVTIARLGAARVNPCP